jgi:hypothetical protein
MLFVKPDITAINKVIYYSSLTRESKLTLFQLRKTMAALRGLNFSIPSFNDLQNVELELLRRLDEIQHASRLLLEPLLEGKDFGHKYLNNWIFATSEIEQGYCKYEEIKGYKNARPYLYGQNYILLLRDYEDSTLGLFYGGTLINYATAEHFIDAIPFKPWPAKGIYGTILKTIELALTSHRKNPISL